MKHGTLIITALLALCSANIFAVTTTQGWFPNIVTGIPGTQPGTTFTSTIDWGPNNENQFIYSYDWNGGSVTYTPMRNHTGINVPQWVDYYGLTNNSLPVFTVAAQRAGFYTNGLFDFVMPLIDDFELSFVDVGSSFEEFRFEVILNDGSTYDANLFGAERTDYRLPYDDTDPLFWDYQATGFSRIWSSDAGESDLVDGFRVLIPGTTAGGGISHISWEGDKRFPNVGGFNVFLFRPIPEPSRIVFILGGLGACVMRRKR